MAKINISFNNKDYSIDESSLSSATAALKSHLSTVMNGTGATINLDGTAYNIDSTKLSTATAEFVTHLGTISGSGAKVNVNGVEYNVSSSKMAGAVSELEAVLGGLNSGSDMTTLAAGLYQSGAIALYEAGDVAGASAMLKTSWEDLVAQGVIAVGEAQELPEGAVLNEYGFYYGIKYGMTMNGMTMSFTFNEDGSAVLNQAGEITEIPAGAIVYGDHIIDMSALEFPTGIVSADGTSIDFGDGIVMSVVGDPKLPEGAELSEYGFYYGAEYSGDVGGVTISFTFNADGSAVFNSPDGTMEIPASAIVYGDHVVDMTALEFPVFTVSEDGTSIEAEGLVLSVGGSGNIYPNGTVYLPELNIDNPTSIIDGDLVIIDDGSATSFTLCAFTGQTSLTGVIIPSGVTSIGDYAFEGCSNLTSITIPDGVTGIGDGAFYNCSSLTSVTIPDSVTSIGEYTFYGCSNLTSVTIPEGVTSIGRSAFYNCSSLTSVNIPDSVTSICISAFSGCSNLTSVTIPEGVTSIGDHAFVNCTSLTSINIPDGVTSIGEYTFYGCTSLTSITIPDSVTSISGRAFYGCTSLTSITIPDSVTSIYGSAFCNCTGLTSVVVSADNKKYHSNGNCVIETSTKALILGCKNSIIPSDGSVTSIGIYAFANCTSLTSINIPEGVTSIGDYAFEGCNSLTSVTIPDSVTSIGYRAFADCSGLISITYTGTMSQWNAIAFGYNWNDITDSYTIHCTDGDIGK